MATEHTLDFVGFYLPPACRVLEVGCGEGHLAQALGRLGHRVIALDTSAEAVAAATARGVDARCEDFLRWEGAERFDAILFTRSLHHLADLDAVFDRVDASLAARGVVLAEEFAWERADAAAARWEHELRFPGEEAPGGDAALARWAREHADCHAGEAMVRAARRGFSQVEAGDCPYLYRAAIAGLEGRADGESVARAVFREELRRIECGAIPPIGLRLVIH